MNQRPTVETLGQGPGAHECFPARNLPLVISSTLAPATAQAALPDAMVEPFAHMLLASLTEIALLIARADDSEAAAQAGKAAIRELLGRILRKR